jgi:hypothetical protein
MRFGSVSESQKGAEVHQKGAEVHSGGGHFGTFFGPKSKENHPKRLPKINAKQIYNFDAKALLKWSQNGSGNRVFS